MDLSCVLASPLTPRLDVLHADLSSLYLEDDMALGIYVSHSPAGVHAFCEFYRCLIIRHFCGSWTFEHDASEGASIRCLRNPHPGSLSRPLNKAHGIPIPPFMLLQTLFSFKVCL